MALAHRFDHGQQTSVGTTGSSQGAVQRLAVQRKSKRSRDGQAADVHAAAERGTAGPSTALPHGAAIQAAFGRHDLSDVRAHVGGAATEAAGAMGAEAFTRKRSIAFGEQPTLHTAAHEAAHVVQQRSGVGLSEGVGQAGDAYERNADAVADRVVQGKSAEDLLPSSSGGSTTSAVQRQEAAAADTAPAPAAAATPATNLPIQLATDFNNIPLYNAGESEAPAGSFQTPYVLNTVDACAEATAIKALVIAAGRPSAGHRVRDVVGNNPFIGKSTPAQMQVIAQAVIDNAYAAQTPATFQAWVDNGRSRGTGRRNGKFGVDCSGFTEQLQSEREGNGRRVAGVRNAASYRSGGGYTNVHPNATVTGDVISFQTTNHVVVISGRELVQLPMAGDTTRTKPAHKISVSEATASGNAGSQTGRVRTDRRFYYFPDAIQVLGSANSTASPWRLAYNFGDALPVWQPDIGPVSYSGGTDWDTSHSINAPGEARGTMIQLKGTNGRFAAAGRRIPNGATNVAYREVDGSMVRVRYNGADQIGGREMWVPLANIADAGAGLSIPSTGQPEGLTASTFSVVRNPNTPAPEPETTPTNAQ